MLVITRKTIRILILILKQRILMKISDMCPINYIKPQTNSIIARPLQCPRYVSVTHCILTC